MRSLPLSVSAFFYTQWASDDQQRTVRAAHASFVRQYRRSATPLLVYDPNGKAGEGGPFTRVP